MLSCIPIAVLCPIKTATLSRKIITLKIACLLLFYGWKRFSKPINNIFVAVVILDATFTRHLNNTVISLVPLMPYVRKRLPQTNRRIYFSSFAEGKNLLVFKILPRGIMRVFINEFSRFLLNGWPHLERGGGGGGGGGGNLRNATVCLFHFSK